MIKDKFHAVKAIRNPVTAGSEAEILLRFSSFPKLPELRFRSFYQFFRIRRSVLNPAVDPWQPVSLPLYPPETLLAAIPSPAARVFLII